MVTAADLYFAAAQQRDDEPGDDGRDNPFFGRDARRDAECDSQRQRDDADDDAGHQVGSERAFRIVFQTVEQFGSELQKFHDAYESIFRDSSVKRLQKYAKNRKMRTVSHVPRVYSFFVRAGGARLIAGRDGAGRSRAANVFSCGLRTVGQRSVVWGADVPLSVGVKGAGSCHCKEGARSGCRHRRATVAGLLPSDR